MLALGGARENCRQSRFSFLRYQLAAAPAVNYCILISLAAVLVTLIVVRHIVRDGQRPARAGAFPSDYFRCLINIKLLKMYNMRYWFMDAATRACSITAQKEAPDRRWGCKKATLACLGRTSWRRVMGTMAITKISTSLGNVIWFKPSTILVTAQVERNLSFKIWPCACVHTAKSSEKNALHIVNHLICFPVGSVSLTVFYAYAHNASNLRIIAFEKARVVSHKAAFSIVVALAQCF